MIAEKNLISQKENRRIPQEPSIFVPRDKEQAYCKKHNIELRRLKNGAIIVGGFRDSTDKAETSILLNFPDGGYNDSSNKKGVSHLVEHLIVYPVFKFAALSNADVNATTSSEHVVVSLSGNANPDVKNYGIWPVVPKLFEALFTPLHNAEDLLAKIDTEKKVIYEEMDVMRNPESQVVKFFVEKLFHPDNTSRYETIGTEESVKELQVADVIATARRILIPDKLLAEIFVHGNEEIHKELIDSLQSQIEKFPRADQKRKQIDPLLSELINPDLTPGSIFEKQIDGLSDEGAVDVNYIWVFPVQSYSKDEIVTSWITKLLHDKFLEYMRDNGLSYLQDVGKDQLKKTTIMNMHFRTKKTPGIRDTILQTISPKIQEQVIAAITDEDLVKLHAKGQLALEAHPITIEDRFAGVLEGLQQDGRIIDPEKIREIAKSITVADYKKWIEKLKTTPPAIIMAGDLKG